MEIRARIVEVLAKYNRKLEDAPLDMLTMTMERMIENRLTVSPLPSLRCDECDNGIEDANWCYCPYCGAQGFRKQPDAVGCSQTSLPPEDLAKLLALREGLPEKPWDVTWNAAVRMWEVFTMRGAIVGYGIKQETAHAIAALPSLFDALEKMGRKVERLEAENDTLRNSVEAVRAEYLQRFMDASARADAIKAKTIEQCAAVGNAIAKVHSKDAMKRCAGNDWAAASTANARCEGATEVALAVRALNQPPEA